MKRVRGKYKRFLTNPNKLSKPLMIKLGFVELPESEKHTPKKKSKPPYYTHYCLISKT